MEELVKLCCGISPSSVLCNPFSSELGISCCSPVNSCLEKVWARLESFPAGVRGPGNLFDAQLFEEPSAMVHSLSVWILLRLPDQNYLQNWRNG